MRTVRFQPRSFLKQPRLFGKTTQSVEWVATTKDDVLESSRQEVARMQHRISVLVAKKATLPDEKAALAKKIGVQPATLGRLLRGEVVMQIETMFLLAREISHELRLVQPTAAGLERERQTLDAVEDFLQLAKFQLAGKERDARKRQSR